MTVMDSEVVKRIVALYSTEKSFADIVKENSHALKF